MPRSPSALVALGLVFDRVHFPGVYLPQGDYDRDLWQREIARITELNLQDYDTQVLLAMMRFAETAERMRGFLCYDKTARNSLEEYDTDNSFVTQLQEALCGPPRPDFFPIFKGWHHKAVPGSSSEHLTYRGDTYYQAGAIQTAGERGIFLVNDLPSLPIPGSDSGPARDAKALSAFIALEAMKFVMPEMPLLSPDALMDFREENGPHLRAFRRAMLRFAGTWRSKLAAAKPEDVVHETQFLVQTEIMPALDELRQAASDPARPWYKRAIDGVRVTASLAGAFMTSKGHSGLGDALAALAPQFITELDAKGEQNQRVRRSDLYYLLKVQQALR